MTDSVGDFDNWFKCAECVVTEQLKSYCCWLLGSRKQPEPSLSNPADKKNADEWFRRCEALY